MMSKHTLLTEVEKGRKVLDYMQTNRENWFYLLRDKYYHLYIARIKHGQVKECYRATREDWN